MRDNLKIAIVGSRDFNDYSLMKEFIYSYIKKEEIELVVSGGARGQIS